MFANGFHNLDGGGFVEDLRQLISDARGSDPRLALAAVHAFEKEVDWLLVRAVRLARNNGYDWGRIARLLGVTRQAARQRDLDGDDPMFW